MEYVNYLKVLPPQPELLYVTIKSLTKISEDEKVNKIFFDKKNSFDCQNLKQHPLRWHYEATLLYEQHRYAE